MTVYHNISTIHVHIPKTGGIALGLHLKERNGTDGNIAGGSHLFLDEYLLSGAVSQEQFDAYHKVAVVRNPWDRCLSAYRYAKQFRPWMEWGEFLEWCVAVVGTVSEKGPTWGMVRLPTRQSRFFKGTDGVEVVRYENLNERFPDMPHVNKVNGRDYLSNADHKTIKETYAEDIEMFGYG